ncbi:UDP-N-acetylglucosamine 2-epimerase (hydrolyzing) [Rodentibacter pneumotropicus]|uniref:UDP-N-acetylglucosamine 2-epimerase (Hydrolyzing) n=3 Tax=Rodentibacter pneumotropicus TaxID=758 RepID=A0A4S2P8Q8_9PAST|nr:UDP-N-acetylglucosamine 2-epimerase [Rodentibacter pneumotropicus]NBH74439.1 UDP-N-acetylglucosamine 2-epimerase (hydrolyzing) [Rodentibacter pneumotropicus]TGZ99253.1 UDP-N-acetylglucosamine 2-epimerase (hydrolyzing) [Rodentibacter pneumotropicus]THA06756.1 UDP-N-acetylglucosamine 2-epimerase (hydrolyzing) [Rodentibacter pneumotropicus]THA09346.1 UDP-N-acetylglucosamine 2-epimerase (hydrolyzing) [Rodentibacter pneumotropicus]THA13571.1 UDP-N-acetylglucosamine 2-epimerase (hydrolyzing) [Rod
MMKKRIAYVTGSRAEYGIVKRLLKSLQNDPELDFSLIVTAMHLDPQYGNTVKIIEEDGFFVREKIAVKLNSQNNQTILTSIAETLDLFGKHFQMHSYDAVMVLGDRYEMLAVATAAAMHNIPLIHLHGGEQTLGNYDEFIRHCITKMSKLHLTATEEYRKRVIQLGEVPESVINVGSLGAENSLLLDLPSKEELVVTLGIPTQPYFMVVFHPETITGQLVEEQIKQLFLALDIFKKDYQFIFIGSNSDTHSDVIFEKIRNYTQKNNFAFFTSIKPEEYLALIKYSKGLIGNSSSGLLEAPSLKVGTVNIGKRQEGRVRGESVIDVESSQTAIEQGIQKLLSDAFQARLPMMVNPYYQENSAEKAYYLIKDFLQNNKNNNPKIFYDL